MAMVVPLCRNPINSVCKREERVEEEEKEEADETTEDPADSLARAFASSCLLMSRTSVYRFAVSLSFLSRDNDTDLRQLSRITVDLNDLTTPAAIRAARS